MSTVESAYAIAAIMAVLCLGIVGVSAVSAQVRCVDAAREVARLSAAGDPAARTVGARVAPASATIAVTSSDDIVEVTVSSRVAMLPGLVVSARAVAAREPDAAAEIGPEAAGAPPDR